MMSLALALLAVGCNDDEIAPDRHPANTGDEVQFGVALPGADTRTIYGEETETGFPVYWVNEDKVKVASPQCNIKEAEYQVTVNSAAQNYADNLTKREMPAYSGGIRDGGFLFHLSIRRRNFQICRKHGHG